MAQFAMQLMLLLLGVLPFLALANPAPAPVAEPEPEPLLGLKLIPLVDALLAIGASPPPPILQTQVKSPECANINQGELMCCRGIIAGDLQPVVFVAALFGYNLNPNDVNGLDCKYIPYPILRLSRADVTCLRECLSGLLFAAPLLIELLVGDRNLTSCPGVEVCCQVTGLVSHVFYVEDPNGWTSC